MEYVLFIDDQQGPLFYHKYAVEQAGYKVIEKDSAEKAAEYMESMAAADLPDVIVLDLNMPTDGRYFGNPQNRDGSRTGILLFKDICGAVSRLTLALPPIIVLTQVQNPDILGEVRQTLLGTPILDKFTTAPMALVKVIKVIIDAEREKQRIAKEPEETDEKNANRRLR
jgi:CheY-like chemotaxis protein